ncbi:MAG: ISL3 family transposase, partial [Proteobacteria bacterium]|nr:ISL3 family transposase [Pseudomonadota bacterium]
MISDLFFQALNLSNPWKVVKVNFSREEKRLDIYLDFERGSKFSCPVCGKEGLKVYDSKKERVWRHLNFFQYE